MSAGWLALDGSIKPPLYALGGTRAGPAGGASVLRHTCSSASRWEMEGFLKGQGGGPVILKLYESSIISFWEREQTLRTFQSLLHI